MFKKNYLAKLVTLSMMVGSVVGFAGGVKAATVNVTTADDLNSALTNAECDVVTIDKMDVGQTFSTISFYVGQRFDTAIQLNTGLVTASGAKTVQGNGLVLYDYKNTVAGTALGFAGSSKDDVLTFDNIKLYFAKSGTVKLENVVIKNSLNNDKDSSENSKKYYLVTQYSGSDPSNGLSKSPSDFTALAVSSSTITLTGQNVQFVDNHSYSWNSGGAMSVTSATVNMEDVVFDGNTVSSGDGGGAHFSKATVQKFTGIFKNNQAGSEGGAVSFQDGTQVANFGGQFLNNTAKYNGGAVVIATEETGAGRSDTQVKVTFAEGSVFKGNKVTTETGNTTMLDGAGGAIYSRGDVTVSKATFGGTEDGEGNEAHYGGAVANTAGRYTYERPTYLGKMQIADSEFICNLACVGGAVYNTSYASYTGRSEDSVHNKWSYANPEVTISGTTFVGNKADKTRDDKYNDNKGFANYYSGNQVDRQGGGGAIYNDATMVVTGSVFGGSEEGQGNRADNGGAIFNVGFAPAWSGTPIEIMYYEPGTMTVTDSTFIGNSALMNGGAIFNGANMILGTDKQTVINFTSNSADKGGAIFNGFSTYDNKVCEAYNGNRAKGIHNEVSTLSISNASFTNNTATTAGGAIYNEAGCSLILENVTFSGNKANGVANDIYNAGTITFKGTKNELGGGLVTAATGSKTVVDTGAVLDLAGGRYTADDVAKFTVNGTLNLTKSGIYVTDTATVFNAKIAVGDYDGSDDTTKKNAFVEANKNNPTGVKSGLTAALGLNLVGGSLEFSDAYYTVAYAKAAKQVLANFKYDGTNVSQTALIFSGKLVSAAEIAPDKESKVLLDEIEEEPSGGSGQEQAPTVYDKVVAETLNGSLFVGDDILKKAGAADDVKQATGGEHGGIEVKDTSKSSISVGALDLANGATGLVIANGKGVTVGGSEGKEKEVNLVAVGGDDIASVNVVVGLDKNTAEVLGVEQTGKFNIGNELADSTAQFKLNGTLTVNEGSTVEVKGQTKVTEKIVLNDAELDVKEGSKVEVPALEVAPGKEANKTTKITGNLNVENEGEGKVELKKDAVLQVGGENKGEEAVLVTDKFHLDDSKLHVGQAANVQANVVTVNSTDTAADSAKNSTLSGKVTANELVVEQAKTSGENKTVVLNVGNHNKKANVKVENTKLQGNILFLDPVWQNGENLIEDASHYATQTTALDGAYVVGRNSVLTFGATNEAADALFRKTGLTWGKDTVSAAAYVADQIDISGGSLTVDGSLEVAPATPAVGAITLAAKSLLMVDGAKVQNKSAITGIVSADVNPGAKVFIANAEPETTYLILTGEGIESALTKGNVAVPGTIESADVDYDSAQKCLKIITGKRGFSSQGTLLPEVGQALVDEKVVAFEKMIDVLPEQQTANVNAVATFGTNLGVSRAAYDTANLVGDAIVEHEAMLRIDEELEMRYNIWATYANTKDKVDGLHMGGIDARYDAKLNSTVVGMDITPSFGAALSYSTGNVNGGAGHNDVKYAGAAIYANRKIGTINVLWDAAYMHGKNELAGCVAGIGMSADAETDVVTMGLRVEKDFKKADRTLTPFVGLRYMCIDGDSYSNNLGMRYDSDTFDTTVFSLGLRYGADIKRNGWNFKPTAEIGCLANLGDLDGKMTVSYKKASDSFGYDLVDTSAFYGKLALGFAKDNFDCKVGYRCLKSSNAKDNKWFVNLSYAF